MEAGIRRNLICYNTCNEIETLEIQSYSCTAAILSAILEFVIRFYQTSTNDVRCHYAQLSEKRSLYIN